MLCGGIGTWTLRETFGDGLKPYDTPTSSGFVSASDICKFVADHPDTRAVASHQASPPAPKVPGRDVFTSILIRDPIARVRSIYAFERKQIAESPGATKAKELNFKEYVEWRLAATPQVFCNYQVHFCCRDGSKRRPAATRADLKKAIANLDGVDDVGTVERN